MPVTAIIVTLIQREEETSLASPRDGVGSSLRYDKKELIILEEIVDREDWINGIGTVGVELLRTGLVDEKDLFLFFSFLFFFRSRDR